MTPRPSRLWNGALLASLALVACTGEIRQRPAECLAGERASAYDAAYDWSADGAAPDGVALDEVATGEAASCALAGVREGLRGRGHGHGHHGGGGELAQCRDDGRFTGEAAAIAYCDLSISLGGLGTDDLLTPGPASSCSRKFEDACHAAFDRAIKRYGQLIGDPSANCRPFAGGAFREAFEVARFNQCLFSIAEPGTDPCANGACECRDQAHCELDCAGEGCDMACERTSSCDVSCGDDCTLACQNTSRCDARGGASSDLSCSMASECSLASAGGTLTCDRVSRCDLEATGPAEVQCTNASRCDIDCPECAVQCRDVGLCKVELERGRVRCDRVGRCEVECEGAPKRRPTRCRDGSYVCGQRCD